MRRVLISASFALLSACGGTEAGTPPPWANGNSGAPAQPVQAPAPGTSAPLSPLAPTATAGAAVNPDDPKAVLRQEQKSRVWKNEDFVESDTNRDPFHPFLADFAGGPAINQQYEILLGKYSLDELKLQMITSPRGAGARAIQKLKRQKNDPECDQRPCAVFLDGTGVGWAVSRNFHISKADAKVVRIDPEKGEVFVEMKEDLGNGKFRMVERVLEMHQPIEGQNQ